MLPKNKLSALPDIRRFVSVTEAAGVLGISRATAYRMTADGQLPTVRLRGRVVVPVAALQRMESAAVAP